MVSAGADSFDPTLLVYDFAVLAKDGRLLHCPHAGLTVEEQRQELATVTRCHLPDVMTDQGPMWMLCPPGTPYYVSVIERGPHARSPGVATLAGTAPSHAVLPEELRELTRGLILTQARRGDAADIELSGSDGLHQLLEHDLDLHVPGGTPVKKVLTDLFAQWGASLGEFAGPDVECPETSWRGERAAKVIDDLLAQWPRQGAGMYLLRAQGDHFDVVTAGGNVPVYWLKSGQGAGVSSYSIDITSMVGSVKVMVERAKGDDTAEEDLGDEEELPPLRRAPRAGTTYSGPEQPTPLDQEYLTEGAGEYGGAQRIIVRQEKKEGDQANAEIAKLEADAELAKQGFPDMTFGHVTYDVPMLHKWDRIRITDRLLDGYFYVAGVAHDASAGTMELELITPEDFERQAYLLKLESQLDQLKNTQAAEKKTKGTGRTSDWQGWNPNTPMPPQAAGYTCSACATAWVLRATGAHPTFTEQLAVEQIGYPTNINDSDQNGGLQDASGTQLIRVLGNYGVPAVKGGQVHSFDEVYEKAKKQTGMMSGAAWYHWVAIRGVKGDAIWVANSAQGYKGINDLVNRADWERLGPYFNLVWVTP